MTTAAIIDELAQKFQAEVESFQGRKVASTFYDAFRKTITEHIEKVAAASAAAPRAAGVAYTPTATKGRTKRDGEGEEPKLDQWPKIWTSKRFGGSVYFKDLYAEIKALTKETNHFKLLKLVRDEVEKDDRWETYIKWVQDNNEHAPKDPPSARKPPSERKKSPTSSAGGGGGGGGGGSSGARTRPVAAGAPSVPPPPPPSVPPPPPPPPSPPAPAPAPAPVLSLEELAEAALAAAPSSDGVGTGDAGELAIAMGYGGGGGGSSGSGGVSGGVSGDGGDDDDDL